MKKLLTWLRSLRTKQKVQGEAASGLVAKVPDEEQQILDRLLLGEMHEKKVAGVKPSAEDFEAAFSAIDRFNALANENLMRSIDEN